MKPQVADNAFLQNFPYVIRFGILGQKHPSVIDRDLGQESKIGSENSKSSLSMTNNGIYIYHLQERFSNIFLIIESERMS